MTIETPVSHIPFVGPLYAGRLAKLGIASVYDFLNHYPFRYDDYSVISTIDTVQPGEIVTVRGTIMSFTNMYTRGRLTIQKARISDDTGTIEVTWFNQPFLVEILKKGTRVNLSGKVDVFHGKPVLKSPEYERISIQQYDNNVIGTIHTGRLVPVYPETFGVSSKWMRTKIAFILKTLDNIEDYLPQRIIETYNLLPLNEALHAIHFPDSLEDIKKARTRLSFDEVFLVQLSSILRKQSWKGEKTPYVLRKTDMSLPAFIKSLPFKLTASQNKSIREIEKDVTSEKPMNRLLQGDVGSGKTVVATAVMYSFYKEGYKSVLMAPTEILANQHFNSIQKMLAPFSIPVALVTGSLKKYTGKERIIIGTTALLFNKTIKNVGLVVIDEQHRFGVEQRTKLQEIGIHPHLLTMTATPIPRSVALVLYSELDLSYIDEMPTGRIPIKTWFVEPEKREKAYEWIMKELKSTNSQAFVVCPLIEESEHETMQSVKAVKKEYESLSRIFKPFRVGLLHGKLTSKEKNDVLDKFKRHTLDILLTTPVVEVGIDIPNATIMMIEASDRFGLAQLHQLRGRIGRGSKQSYCLLFSESQNIQSINRLKSLEKLTNGASLAELDLKLRGPGQMYGIRQHGYETFKLASFSDRPLFALTKQAAYDCLESGEIERNKKLQNKLKSYTIHKISPN